MRTGGWVTVDASALPSPPSAVLHARAQRSWVTVDAFALPSPHRIEADERAGELVRVEGAEVFRLLANPYRVHGQPEGLR